MKTPVRASQQVYDETSSTTYAPCAPALLRIYSLSWNFWACAYPGSCFSQHTLCLAARADRRSIASHEDRASVSCESTGDQVDYMPCGAGLPVSLVGGKAMEFCVFFQEIRSGKSASVCRDRAGDHLCARFALPCLLLMDEAGGRCVSQLLPLSPRVSLGSPSRSSLTPPEQHDIRCRRQRMVAASFHYLSCTAKNNLKTAQIHVSNCNRQSRIPNGRSGCKARQPRARS